MPIIRKVIDSNMMRDDGLRRFLVRSHQNFAVIPDYVAMEAYKGDDLNSIFDSMEILSCFSKQVIVLKDTGKICGLSGKAKGLQNRFIDKDQTQGFPKFCRDLRLSQQGDSHGINSILGHKSAANEHLDLLVNELANLAENVEELMAEYTDHELKIIRRGDAFSDAIADKIMHSVISLSGFSFAKHPNVSKLPELSELTNTYIFRSSLMNYIAMIDWMAVGGLRNMKPEKIRNDMVDMHIATYATFYDGLITKEKRLQRRYNLAKAILEKWFDTKVN